MATTSDDMKQELFQSVVVVGQLAAAIPYAMTNDSWYCVLCHSFFGEEMPRGMSDEVDRHTSQCAWAMAVNLLTGGGENGATL